VTIAVFQSRGIVPVSIQSLNKSVRIGAIISMVDFITLVGIAEIPGPLK